jgi:hypothetical protein
MADNEEVHVNKSVTSDLPKPAEVKVEVPLREFDLLS